MGLLPLDTSNTAIHACFNVWIIKCSVRAHEFCDESAYGCHQDQTVSGDSFSVLYLLEICGMDLNMVKYDKGLSIMCKYLEILQSYAIKMLF